MNESASPKYVVAGALSDFAPGEIRPVEIDGTTIAVANVDGELFAIEDTCTHREGPLSEGLLKGFEVTCPYHFARFDVRSGDVRSGPACKGVRSFPVRIVDGRVEICIS